MNKKLIWVLVGVIAVIIFFGVYKQKNDDAGVIKIGAVLPMTGIAANYGEHQSNAIRLAADEINAKGGIKGRKIEIVLEDDGTEAKRTVSAFKKVTEVDHVPVVIGAVWDFLANAVMPVVDSKKVPTISASVPPDSLDKTSDVFFTTFPPIYVHQPIIEKYLRIESGEKVAIVYVNNAWGRVHRDTYKKAVSIIGKKLVAEIELPKFDNNDIQREITLLKNSSPDILLTAVNLIDPKLIIEKNKELGLNARIFGHDNLIATYSNVGINKDAIRGVVAYRVQSPSSEFVTNYKSKYGKEPLSEADRAYDAMHVIAKAIQNSGDFSSAGIVKGLKQIKDYQGASGVIDYTKSNWPTAETALLEIFDGEKFVPYLQ